MGGIHVSLHDETNYKIRRAAYLRSLRANGEVESALRSPPPASARDPRIRGVARRESAARRADERSVYLLSGAHGTERRVRKARGFRETWHHGKNADLPLLTSSLLGAAAAATAEFADKPISAFILSRGSQPQQSGLTSASRSSLEHLRVFACTYNYKGVRKKKKRTGRHNAERGATREEASGRVRYFSAKTVASAAIIVKCIRTRLITKR